jgi:hypothetical protein
MPEVIEQVDRKAKKEHICDYCGQKIEIGEIYEDQACVQDGVLYHWKSHMSCKELTRELQMEGYDEGLTAEDFREYVNNYLADNNISAKTWTERIAKAKEMLCGREV